MPYIKIEDLTFSYNKNDKPALDNLSVSFETNKIHVILGKSGGGKSTLLRSICGLNEYKGHIYFDDIPIENFSLKERNIGYVNQNLALYPHFDLFTSIAYPLRASGVGVEEIKARVFEIANTLKIEKYLSRKPRQVSLGQLQRASIARALVKRPLVCLFDEPFSNIDEETKSEIRFYLKDALKQFGCTTIFVTHDLKEATALADYIYLLEEGKIIASGTVTEILDSEKVEVKEFFETLKDETF